MKREAMMAPRGAIMAFFDLPIDQLRGYKPPRREEKDFDSFWASTMDEAARHPLDPRFEPYPAGLDCVEAFDASFSGFGGERVAGWLVLPAPAIRASLPGFRAGRLPCVVEYIGYGGGRAFPWDWLFWAAAGFAHFVMDSRGQGASWSPGDTADRGTTGPSAPGFMTRGIDSPEDYYYRRIMVDAARAVDAAAAYPAVDPDRLCVTGGSQGGGLSIAAAALSKSARFLMPDVPFLCCYRRATEITDNDPYHEISRYIHARRDSEDAVFRTLSYFDGVNFAARTKVPALYSVALMDKTCPPSTVFAAYNWHAGEKEIREYSYNDHEGGGTFQAREKLAFARKRFLG
jgi:cephalosporin-C deacetylase